MKRSLLQILIIILLAGPAMAEDPIRIQGSEQSALTDKLPDGGLPPVVGVTNI